jgi:tetratricopeptide (TPR) repeat protein
MKRLEEAKSVYQTALKYDFTNADIYYNIGVVNIELGLTEDALDEFIKALQVDPNHVQSLLNSAILMQSSGKPELRPLAYERLHKVLRIAPKDHSDRVYFNLGMLAMDDEDSANAEVWFKQAVDAKPGFRSALFNLALLLNEQKRPLEAVPYLKDLLKYFPDHIKGLILLGEIYTNHVKDLDAAEQCYRKIISVDPKHVQGHHNLCVVLVEQGRLVDARDCLLEVQKMAPTEDYVRKHLSVVENKIKNTKPPLG